MTAKLVKLVTLAGVVGLSVSCGDFVRQGRSPVQLVVMSIEDGNGQGTLLSDVANTTTDPCSPTSPCQFNDVAKAGLRIQLKDPGSLGVTGTFNIGAMRLITFAAVGAAVQPAVAYPKVCLLPCGSSRMITRGA